MLDEFPTDDAVFTLFDGDYHIGLAALTNSLYRVGFRGIVYAGYRGALPPWTKPAVAGRRYEQYEVAEGCAIRFIKVDFCGHLTNYKAAFILRVLEEFHVDPKRLFLFDADIVVKCHWSFFQRWVECGIAVCADVNEPDMSGNHPLRAYWREIAARCGFECRQYDGYFNAGFVGMRADHILLFERWRTLIEHIEQTGTSLNTFLSGDRSNPIMAPDQDMLNAALMTMNVPISPMDGSGMDISRSGYVMSHPLSRAKPWRRRYIRDALRGYPPDTANKVFWTKVAEPIEVLSPARRWRALLSLAIAGAVGRFYRRT